MKKKFLALLLAALMVVSLLPVTAWADGSATVPVDENGFDYAIDGVTFVPGDYCVVDLTTGKVTEMKNVTSAATFNTDEYKTTKMAFRYVPAGKFKANCASSTGYKTLASNDVALSAYWIAVFPVTEAQYNAVMGGATTSKYPKVSVTWNDFRGGDWTGWDGTYANVPAPGDGTFVKALNDKVAAAGCTDMFDLCTSFQWERAARAGTRTDYYFSDKTAESVGDGAGTFDSLKEYAWYLDNNSPSGAKAVGGKLPNAWGLYDVYGNSYNLCLDGNVSLNGVTPGTDYVSSFNSQNPQRVGRGGCYSDYASYCSSVYRVYRQPSQSSNSMGFRLVRKLVTSPSITVSKVKVGSSEKDIANPIYGTAMTATDFFTVATKNFKDTPTLKLEWKQSDSTWGETAPTGITANLNASTKLISIATTATLNAGDYPFRVTNSAGETIKDKDGQDIPNPDFVSSGEITLTVEKCSTLPNGTPTSKTVKGLINTADQTGNIDLALLGVTLPGATIKSFGTETDVSNIVTIDTSAKTYTFANTATKATATLELTISSDNYADFTYTLTFETVDKTPVTVSGVSMNNSAYTYGDTVGYTGTPIAKIGEDSDVTENIDAWTYTYYQNNGTSDTPNWVQLENAPINAGNYKLVVAADDDEYVGTQEIEFGIAKKAVKIEGIAVQDKTYNGKTDDAVIVLDNVSFTGKLAADNLTISGITGTYASANASDTQTVNLNAFSAWTLGGESVANYMLATEGQPTSVTGKISKATPTLTGVQATAISYGQTLADSTVTGTATNENKTSDKTVEGTFAFTTGETIPALSDSETTEYDVTFTPTNTNNYNTVSCKVKIKVTHTHNPVKVTGQAATETAAGWSDYYECKDSTDACHKYFEDATAKVEITDLDAWKAQGGKGYIAPLVHSITPVNGKNATDTEAGYNPYYECKNCGKYYEDATGLIEISNIDGWKAEGGAGYLAPLHGTDNDHDHICDYCDRTVSNHIDADNNHICDICSKTISNHIDTEPKDHICDICGKTISNHADSDKNHLCDICGKTISNHADTNKDHVCDYCGKTISSHTDTNKDHVCDYCGKTISSHVDTDPKDHVCDYCGKTISNHTDTNTDHICDYCGETISNHADTNKDHKCDYCGKIITNHVDEDGNKDHLCDICGDVISNHEDTNKDHVCDICGKTISNHTDADPKDHICDYCGKTINNHADEDKDHICDYCEKAISNHEDTDKDHICEYCGKVISNHNGVLVEGTAATLESAGFKSYYKCDCGKLFEDATCKVEITDLDAWKAQGGNGYIAKLEEEPTSPQTGDNSHMTLWVMLLALSSMGLCACLVLGKKRKKEQ